VAAAALSQPARGLRRVPTPASEPPYDEAATPRRAVLTPSQLALPFPHPTRPAEFPRPHLRLVPDPPAELPAPPAALPALRTWAETAALAIAQILTGERAPGSFRSAVVPEVYDLLSRKAALAARGPRFRAALRAVRVCCPARGIAEVTTVVHGLPRPRAVAFRLEARRTRWVCTELELG
jgi:hypothetical protein